LGFVCAGFELYADFFLFALAGFECDSLCEITLGLGREFDSELLFALLVEF
jgi:hypothetical protein